ncbi:MAG: replication-associated recombination protein A [Planctomycetota bacterium]
MTGDAAPLSVPLAERLRPRSFAEVVGQEEIVGSDGLVPRLLAGGRPPSLILWGPPGCGKTTVARLIAEQLGLPPVAISAVTAGVKDIKQIVEAARDTIRVGGEPTLLFVDEIHRFNKAQQDAFLGPLEDGTLVLLGATTENPSFELNSALLSRCRVAPFRELARADLGLLLLRALGDQERGLAATGLDVSEAARERLLDMADGDARSLLTDLECLALGSTPETPRSVDEPDLQALLARRTPRFDRAGDEHFNTISALHKSLRGSDPQAGLYWLARMLEGGEDPLYIARRLVRFAAEDVGLADPQALTIAVAARDAVHFIGLPEGALALAELVVYLATAPKSDRIYRAYGAAVDEVRRSGSLPVPLEVRNAPTRLMSELGYGSGYENPHASEDGLNVPFLPEQLRGTRFYEPGALGFEREIRKRIEYYDKRRRPQP